MHIFLWGLMVLGCIVGLIVIWFAIHLVGVGLARFYEWLPQWLQDALLILGLVLLAVAIIATLGTFYWMGRWEHGIPLSVILSIVFTAIACIIAAMVTYMAGVFFGWVED